MSTTSPRRSARLIAGVVAGAALVLAAPLAASAHVHVSPADSDAGTTTRLDFSFSHGCDDSPTTALVITIPEGLDGVKPVLDGAWTISTEVGVDGIPTEVTYTAKDPIATGIAASVALDVVFASSAANTEVAFPVLQTCTEGETDWSEVAAEGQTEDDLEAPAPVVAVGDVVEETGQDHADAGDEHADATDHEEGHSDAAEAADAQNPAALWLGGGALVVALAALGVALVGRRKA